MPALRHPSWPLAAVVALLLPLAGCGGSSPSESGAAVSGPSGAAPGASGAAGFPVTMKNAWGTSTIEKKPERVAVVSGGDRDIAYALGVKPIITPVYPTSFHSPYVAQKEKELGIANATTYDGEAETTNVEAIAAARPDVILATNTWSNDADYAKLSKIAPVVAVETKEAVDSASWVERTRLAAKGLGLVEEGEKAIAAAKKVATDAAAAHPGWKGKTYTYAVAHPTQLTYASHGQTDPGVFEDLGLVKAPNAKKFSPNSDAVSMERLSELDADAIFLAFPFGKEGSTDVTKLAANPLWNAVPAVKAKRWAVIPAESGLASDVAYPSILGYPWVVEQMTPIVERAVTGRGGAS